MDQESPHLPKGDGEVCTDLVTSARTAQGVSRSGARRGRPVPTGHRSPGTRISIAGRQAGKPPGPKQQLVHRGKKKKRGKKKFSFQIIEPTVVKTSRLICTTRSMHSTLINWWNILQS